MNYIIKIDDNKYFAGWDAVLGHIKIVDDRNLAYRMRRPIANNTLPKIIAEYKTAVIEKL